MDLEMKGCIVFRNSVAVLHYETFQLLMLLNDIQVFHVCLYPLWHKEHCKIKWYIIV